MKFDGIKEVNEMPSDTSQVYVSNYGLIRGMMNSPYVNNSEYIDDEAVIEHNVDNGSVYDQGLDDVSFNIQEVQNIQKSIKTNDFETKSEVVTEKVKEEVKESSSEVKKESK